MRARRRTLGVVFDIASSLPSLDAALALLRRARDDLESSAATARGLAADMNWQSDAVRHVHEWMEGIERQLTTLAAGTQDAMVDVAADRRRLLDALALLAL